MWRTSRTAPMPVNARSTAWAARRWPAPADADSTSTLPSWAILFSRCEISVSVRPFSDCNEPGPEFEDKRRTVNGCPLAPLAQYARPASFNSKSTLMSFIDCAASSSSPVSRTLSPARRLVELRRRLGSRRRNQLLDEGVGDERAQAEVFDVGRMVTLDIVDGRRGPRLARDLRWPPHELVLRPIQCGQLKSSQGRRLFAARHVGGRRRFSLYLPSGLCATMSASIILLAPRPSRTSWSAPAGRR